MSRKYETVGNVEPGRARVPPRVRILPGEASLPIERQVQALLTKKVRGAVRLVGLPGSGKSMALAHLAATIEPDWPVAVFESLSPEVLATLRKTHLVVHTDAAPSEERILEMSPWSCEDAIEYLLATHPGRVRAVMGKLKDDPTAETLDGVAELWRIVLDEMAADDGVANVEEALACFLARELSDVRDRDAAERACLFSLAPWGITRPAVGYSPEKRVERIIRHEPVKMLLAAQRLTDGLRDKVVWDELKGKLPGELIERCGKLAARSPAAVQTLDQMAHGQDDQVHAMAASILRAVGNAWRPVGPRKMNLTDARLAGVMWSAVNLNGSSLMRADLRNARLIRAILTEVDLTYANLSGAFLVAAKLVGANLRQARLCRADLSEATMYDATLTAADLTGARLGNAVLGGARLGQAILRGAILAGSDLVEADLRGATVEDADFSGANLSSARLAGLSLKSATVNGACFSKADLSGCDLEELEGPADFAEANLSKSYLTGSIMHGGNFHGATLSGCGLADIDWEGADLRDADLRGSTFHMGSTRSGLVGSDVPCEGSRTGFYTDDFQDREFLDPRAVRKANLSNADLRGANVDGVDFYLVDLRGARYSGDQAQWFAKCGAITCERH